MWGTGDLCRATAAKRGLGKGRGELLRKALEVIEARCSDDISSPPRCRRRPSSKLRRHRNTIVTIHESRVKSDFGSASARVAACASLYAYTYTCIRVCIWNACTRVRSIGSPVVLGEALLAELRDFANLTIAESIADIRYWRLKWNQFRIRRRGVPSSATIARSLASSEPTEISKIERGLSPSIPLPRSTQGFF